MYKVLRIVSCIVTAQRFVVCFISSVYCFISCVYCQIYTRGGLAHVTNWQQIDASFVQVITRDYEPCKPDPSPALHVCNHWQLDPEQVAFVGDDKTDMICGIRAGTGGTCMATVVVRNLTNVLLVSCLMDTASALAAVSSVYLQRRCISHQKFTLLALLLSSTI